MQLLDSNLLDQRVLEVIAEDHPRSVEGCCKCMFEKWLSTEKKASWNQLIQAIENIGLSYLAMQLERKLTGENYMVMHVMYCALYKATSLSSYLNIISFIYPMHIARCLQ